MLLPCQQKIKKQGNNKTADEEILESVHPLSQ